jgi:hypothetical protein
LYHYIFWFDNGNGGSSMIDWNIVLYIGLFLITSGFGLFLYSEMKLREIDRKIAENDRFINAVLRMREDNNNG